MQTIHVTKNDFFITTDISKMDVHAIHSFLSQQSHWAKGISYDLVKKSIDYSLPFGLFHQEKQIGFARIISDYATIAYLGDVYVLEDYRKQGLADWLIETVMTHPDLQGLRRWILLTADAHPLYRKHGWQLAAMPERYMEIHDADIYAR